jgi:hypothetical protein
VAGATGYLEFDGVFAPGQPKSSGVYVGKISVGPNARG